MNDKGEPANPMKIRIRPMDRSDLEAVLDIDAQIVGGERATSWSADVAEYLSGGLSLGCRVAEVEGKLVGFLLGDIRGFEYGIPKGGWIDIMGVSPQYQQSRIGSELVESFCNYCRRLGVQKIFLLAERDDVRIKSFFGSVGFAESSHIVLERDI